jgi:RNA polymerase sigma-70 factor (ECF subfamily)
MKKTPCIEIPDNKLIEKSILDSFYFSCLYYRFENSLKRYIKRISSFSEEEIDDILQESFIKIWKNLHDYNIDIKLSSWIYRIVHNQTISQWRKSKSYGKDQKVPIDETIDTIELIDEKSNIDEIEKETQSVIKKLPLKYQNVLILKYFEDKNYEEISDILEIPEGTVATNLNRAKKAFYKLSKTTNISFFNN